MSTQHETTTREEFICEELFPERGSGDAAMASHGEPGLPRRFAWREQTYEVVRVLETWKTQSPCRHGSGEMYLRRHWYRLQVLGLGPVRRADEQDNPGTKPGALTPTSSIGPLRILTVYCDRQAKNRRKPKSRWWVYSAGPEGRDG